MALGTKTQLFSVGSMALTLALAQASPPAFLLILQFSASMSPPQRGLPRSTSDWEFPCYRHSLNDQLTANEVSPLPALPPPIWHTVGPQYVFAKEVIDGMKESEYMSEWRPLSHLHFSVNFFVSETLLSTLVRCGGEPSSSSIISPELLGLWWTPIPSGGLISALREVRSGMPTDSVSKVGCHRLAWQVGTWAGPWDRKKSFRTGVMPTPSECFRIGLKNVIV